MSAIRGSGHGSAHDWERDITDRFKGRNMGTRYFCRHNDAVFVHLYNVIPDIFAAMEMEGVSGTCVGPPADTQKAS